MELDFKTYFRNIRKNISSTLKEDEVKYLRNICYRYSNQMKYISDEIKEKFTFKDKLIQLEEIIEFSKTETQVKVLKRLTGVNMKNQYEICTKLLKKMHSKNTF